MKRREFLARLGGALTVMAAPRLSMSSSGSSWSSDHRSVKLALFGDVMTGRGIDQVMAHPCEPTIYETHVRNAARYVELAEAVNGPIAKPVEPSYIWGDALLELQSSAPDVRIINLETAVTRSEDYWQGKGINYRMHPDNISCITAAGIDCCALANNHTLDWGHSGLTETLRTINDAGLMAVGAGQNRQEAERPAILELPGKGRVLVLSVGLASSGIPPAWAATEAHPGVSLLPGLAETEIEDIATRIDQVREPRDVVVLSVHWGSNWGYEIPERHRWFAHRLIDGAGVDVVHGHSSHHPLGIEAYQDRPILYGCGDFLNDYEGIGGHEAYRGDLVLMYLVSIDPATGGLVRLELAPFQIRRFRAQEVAPKDREWLQETMTRICRPLGTRVVTAGERLLELRCSTG